MESGAGDPIDLVLLDEDGGAGSPEGAPDDTGAGSPVVQGALVELVPLTPWAPGDVTGWDGTFPDYGGEIAMLKASTGALPWGTYIVRVADKVGTSYPDGEVGCSWPGLGTSLRPVRGSVPFVVPPLPLGVYDLRVRLPDGELLVIEDAFRVVWGNLPRDFHDVLGYAGREFLGRGA